MAKYYYVCILVFYSANKFQKGGKGLSPSPQKRGGGMNAAVPPIFAPDLRQGLLQFKLFYIYNIYF